MHTHDVNIYISDNAMRTLHTYIHKYMHTYIHTCISAYQNSLCKHRTFLHSAKRHGSGRVAVAVGANNRIVNKQTNAHLCIQ